VFEQEYQPIPYSGFGKSRLWSLGEIMKPFHAHLYIAYVRGMETVQNGLNEKWFGRQLLPMIDLAKAREVFQNNLEMCKELGLIASTVSAHRVVNLLSETSPSQERIRALVVELQDRMIDEMSMPRFLSLTVDEAAYYNKPTRGWAEVIERFPSAIIDIEEMGKCFALSRYAGAVFHSIQAIECGLIEFGKFLEVNDPISGWTAVSKRLDLLVNQTKYPDLAPRYKDNFAFLEQMHGTVDSLKNAWRNKISHAHGRLVLMTSEFSPDVAEEIMVASRSFMRRLATEMP
jgi:hypothetical protein